MLNLFFSFSICCLMRILFDDVLWFLSSQFLIVLTLLCHSLGFQGILGYLVGVFFVATGVLFISFREL